MSGNDLEREVIRMGDVGVAIDMVDNNLAEGKLEQAERAVVILREIFAARNDGLRNCFYGGEWNAGRTSRQSRAMNSREKPSPAAIRA